jgi:hypothetical protein
LIAVVVTAANVQDYHGAKPVLGTLNADFHGRKPPHNRTVVR